MKKLFLLFLLFCLSTKTIYSQSVGITFFKGSWGDLLVEAKRQQKPIFVDVYTTWCRPCKVLDKQIFPQEKVGNFYNKNFINYKVDAELGEGSEIAKKYGIVQYPTLLYLDTNLDVYSPEKVIQTENELIEEGEVILKKMIQSSQLKELSEQYPSHQFDKEFILEYVKKLSDNNLPTQSILDTYLSKIPESEWILLENLQIIGSCFSSMDSKAYQVLYPNFSMLVLNESEASTRALINMSKVQRKEKKRAIATHDEVLLDKCLNLRYLMLGGWSDKNKATLDSQFVHFRKQAKIDLYFTAKDWMKYHQECKSYVNEQNIVSTNPLLLNTYAFQYFENITNKAFLEEVLKWLNNSPEFKINPIYQNTYACLLFKTGKKKEAIKMEEEILKQRKGNQTEIENYKNVVFKMKNNTLLKK